MVSISREPLEYVLGKYNIDVIKIRNESYKEKKGVWWVHTSDDFKVLKKVSNPEDTLKYIISAIYHLCDNGIKIPSINKTKDGKDYVKVNDSCYILSDAAKGKNPSYKTDNEFKIVVTELAKFHKASQNFHPKAGTKPKVHLGKWIDEYTKRLEDMNNFYKRDLNKNQSGEIGEIIIKEFPFFYNRAKEAISGLKGKEYKDWVDKVEKVGGLCHQDFAAGNLLLSPTGDVYVLDTDSLTIDIPARDIRKLLNKIMRKNGKWSLELLKTFINTYQITNPLSYSEWKVVKLDLMFPHLFLGAMSKFYYQRDKEWGFDKYLKKIKEICEFEKTFSPVLDSFDSLIPGL